MRKRYIFIDSLSVIKIITKGDEMKFVKKSMAVVAALAASSLYAEVPELTQLVPEAKGTYL